MHDRAWKSYFSVVSALLLFLSIVAFSDNLFTDVGQSSNKDPKFIVHGMFGLAWYVLLLAQANLIRMRNVRWHQRLGVATFIVAIGVTLSTLYVFVVVWTSWNQMTAEVRANRLFLVGYAVCVLLAWQQRRRPDQHKRLIFIGTFFMLGPVLSRAYDPLVLSWVEPMLSDLYTEQVDEAAFLTFFFAGWIGFFLSMMGHDWRVIGRPHAVTMAGLLCFGSVWLVSAYA